MPHLRLLPLALGLLLLAAGCSAPGPYPHNPAVSDARGTPRDSTTFYFANSDTLPPDYIPRDKRPPVYLVDGRVMDCKYSLVSASNHLVYFRAPILSNYYLGQDLYRFLWMRSFHRPVLLTLRRSSNGVTLRTQLLSRPPDRHGDVQPDVTVDSVRVREEAKHKIIRQHSTPAEWRAYLAQEALYRRPATHIRAEETTRTLGFAQWQQFEKLLATASFQKMPACKPITMLDGAEWLLEAHRASGYHAVLRQSPDSTDAFRAACEYLLDLSSAKNEERY